LTYLLDTNVVSEWAKPRPNPGVVAWLAEADEDRVFISVITLAELRRGVERLAVGRRRRWLEEWLAGDLLLRFEGRILAIDVVIAEAWGRMIARGEGAGQRMNAMDGFIAATAAAHDLTLVTRNVADFEGSVKSIVNPWAE
jgi:predicted nucleic acid-binding protein